LAATTSSMKVNERDCDPSPCTVGDRPDVIASMNRGTTAA